MNLDAISLSGQPRGPGEQAPVQRFISVFVCSNCARPGRVTTSGGWCLPAAPNFGWPWPVRQVLVPCTGRLQPEHVLKAFESGSEAVCMVGCQEDDCHFLEGSKRCARRADFIRAVLEEIGLEGRRLMLFHLPGTAAQDMALASGGIVEAPAAEALDTQASAIRDAVIGILRGLPPNPLCKSPVTEADDAVDEPVELSDEYND